MILCTDLRHRRLAAEEMMDAAATFLIMDRGCGGLGSD